jgi:hypothetical protein
MENIRVRMLATESHFSRSRASSCGISREVLLCEAPAAFPGRHGLLSMVVRSPWPANGIASFFRHAEHLRRCARRAPFGSKAWGKTAAMPQSVVTVSTRVDWICAHRISVHFGALSLTLGISPLQRPQPSRSRSPARYSAAGR